MSALKRLWAQAPLLALLLLIDIFFIANHFLYKERGVPSPYSISADGNIVEIYGYLKWMACVLALLYAFGRRRDLLYFAWALLFFYFLLDDAALIHERLGKYIAGIFFSSEFVANIRAKSLGELVVSAAAGVFLLGFIAFAYFRRGADASARAFTRQMAPWLGMLVFCGVVVDTFGSRMRLPLRSSIIEDGGEMIAASFLTALAVQLALELRPGREP